ncbi:aminotransferase class IV family protein [Nocardia higoensis]|uniref:Aminotransferase class IV family protein n=1 Tax=Nocardia higoensis TaxID=228599 RepID=A0ABS0DFG8_9NOCA|nr:aminotransferase class IV family protein [Nocardia higoensis]MBF6356613.1 aminotransferase class IV family protein [Nocardia higoensis]
MSISHTYFNGQLATADDLAPLAFAGYAHFTAMQVRDRAVRGLDLHLDRLREASDELFGRHLPDERIRGLLSSAVRSAPPEVSLTCFLGSRPGEFMRTDGPVEIDVLIRVTDPAAPPTGPLTLDVVPHERHLPHIKHVGEVAKTQLLRRANARGFDDAAFTDASGHLSEATIWNIAFWDGRSVIWPEAAVLPGITMRVLKRRLAARGVDQLTRAIRVPDLSEGLAGVVMNSWSPGIPVARIGEQALGAADELVSLLHQAYASEPPVAL